jgi:tetratricopeptide (TPR) repeat protein
MSKEADSGQDRGQAREYLIYLRKLLAIHCNEEEIKTLCFDVGVGYDDLSGDTLAGKARELVSHLEKRGRIADLVRVGQAARPDLDWARSEHPAPPPSPAAPPASETVSPRPSPLASIPGALYQLRPPVPDFVSREQERADLVQRVRSGQEQGAVAIISGMGGQGKTEMAYVVAHDVRDAFPDGMLLVELRGASEHETPLSPEDALLRVIQTFDPQSAPSEDIGRLLPRYRSALDGRRVLIVADDAASAEQVRHMVPPAGSALLITTRHRFDLPGVPPLWLKPMDEAGAVLLLQTICPRIGNEQARRLAGLCGRLPLALRVSASLLLNDETWGVESYLEALADVRQRLAYLYDPENPRLDVEASLTLSYERLEPREQTILQQAGVFPSSFNLATANAIVDVRDVPKLPPPPESHAQQEKKSTRATKGRKPKGRGVPMDVQEGLSRLHCWNLVDFDTSVERYTLHTLVRAFALVRLGEDGEKEHSVSLRYAHHYAKVAAEANKMFEAGGEKMLEGVKLFDRERANIDAGWHWTATYGDDALRLNYVLSTIGNALADMRYHARRDRLPRAETMLAAARRLRRRKDEAVALGAVGKIHQLLGDLQRTQEYYSQALKVAVEVRDIGQQAAVQSNLSTVYRRSGQITQAIENSKQYLAFARKHRQQKLEGNVLINLGLDYLEQGEMQQALEHFEKALQIARSLGDYDHEGASLGNQGYAHALAGNTEQAIPLCEESLRIQRQLGYRRHEGYALHFLGVAYQVGGNIEQAAQTQAQALTIARKQEDRWLESGTLNAIAEVCLWRGDVGKAAKHLEESLALASASGFRRVLAHVAWNRGLTRLLQAAEQAGETLPSLPPDLTQTAPNHATALARMLIEGIEVSRLPAQQVAEAASLMQERVAYEQEIGHAQAAEHADIVARVRQHAEP